MIRPRWTKWLVMALGVLGLPGPRPLASSDAPDAPRVVTVGSKGFTESVILGEMLRQLAQVAGAEARHKPQLGGTRVVWNALLAGEIDAYVEYTGTLRQEILVAERLKSQADLEGALRERGLRMSEPLGFSNSYAIGVKADLAEKLRLRTLSDLRGHPELILGFANEFMDRADGWRGLRRTYRLPQANVHGLDHDLAYRGIESGDVQVTDLYTTDAEVDYYRMQLLEDDLGYFPAYQAVILYRADLAQRAPEVIALFQRLEGRIDATAMRAMNARAKLHGVAEARIAADFLHENLKLDVGFQAASVWQHFWQHTREHLTLVGISLGAAILVAVPLGILAARGPRIAAVILGITGVLQTIPTLALFVFMIPLLGIGAAPALMALFLYSLLPIIRNTYAGLKDISPAIIESATALGLPRGARLRIVELPLASRAILAGIKTSAVINVGTATLSALIGAGGYGEPILTGIRLDNIGLILQGAVPAAVLALLVQGLFDRIERIAVPKGLRLPAKGQGFGG